MNFRERVLNIFQRKPVDNIVFQPRMEYWFNRNKELGTLPPHYCDMGLFDFFDELNCSIRPYAYYNECLEKIYPPGVKKETFVSIEGSSVSVKTQELYETRAQFTKDVFIPGSIQVERWSTPYGVLETHISSTNLAWHVNKYPVVTHHDIRAMKYILEGTTYRFNMKRFYEVDALIGLRSAPMMWFPRVNIQRLFVELMGFEGTIFALQDQPKVMEDFIQTIDASDEKLLDVIADCPVTIISFDDNMDQNLVSPDLFKRYVLPVYRHRVNRLHSAGNMCHAHWDGSCRLLLPFAHDTGLDGIEALTPEPQGDVTIEEIKAALGEEMVLLDGIPMTAFLPFENDEYLERITRQVIELFAPNLILGISDEPSPSCLVDKIRLVSEVVCEYEGKVMELAMLRESNLRYIENT